MVIWCKEGHYNNPQVIHKRPVHQLINCEINVVNKQTNQDVFNCKLLRWSKTGFLKYFPGGPIYCSNPDQTHLPVIF